jgi:hypothetical protein
LDRPSHVQRGQVRAFSSDGDEGGEGSEESHEVHAEIEEEEENLTDLIPHPSSSRGGSLSDIAVPDDFPEVPLISLSRHPLFPKFVKLLEISDQGLMEIIRRRCRLSQPYAGAFFKER